MPVFRRALTPALILVSLGAALGAADTTIKFTDFRLKNGLRVIISEDHSAPTVSVAVTYNVGSADEKVSVCQPVADSLVNVPVASRLPELSQRLPV